MSKITLPPLPTEAASYMLGCNIDIPKGAPLYTAEQMQERDRQIVEHVIRACAQAARNAPAHPNDATYCEAAVLALLPVKEPKE